MYESDWIEKDYVGLSSYKTVSWNWIQLETRLLHGLRYGYDVIPLAGPYDILMNQAVQYHGDAYLVCASYIIRENVVLSSKLVSL